MLKRRHESPVNVTHLELVRRGVGAPIAISGLRSCQKEEVSQMSTVIGPCHHPAAVYCRVSTEEQRERQSIDTQKELIEKYCEIEGLQIAGFYLDDGVSGTLSLDARPEGRRLLEDAKDHGFGTVLVYRLDRLGRDPRLTLNAVDELGRKGVCVKSATEPFDTTTPTGRFLLTMLSGVAGLERDIIVERSMLGTQRLAREGVWLGGIVPYGYRVDGKDRASRLVPSEDRLPGFDLSEADVVRLIYRQVAEEHRSCPEVAKYLNALGIPPSYARDGRKVLRGKRKEATAAVWWPGRVRNLIVSTTYKGVHLYGKRSKHNTEPIARTVPALVEEATWKGAQQVLKGNFLFNPRGAKRDYLLRGLMKCSICGLTYIGSSFDRVNGRQGFYYVCNGKHGGRSKILQGERCQSKSINGRIEDVIWGEIEGFLRNPGEVLAALAQERQGQRESTPCVASELESVEAALRSKATERELILDLYRRRMIVALDLERQLQKIGAEEKGLADRAATLRLRAEQVDRSDASLSSATDVLQELSRRLDGPLTWDIKRRLVEMLVDSIKVETKTENPRKTAEVTVKYRFTRAETYTGKREAPRLRPFVLTRMRAKL